MFAALPRARARKRFRPRRGIAYFRRSDRLREVVALSVRFESCEYMLAERLSGKRFS